MTTNLLRTRWAAIGAAVAVTIGAGGFGVGYATSPSGATAFVPITPCRLVDTRPAPDTVGPRTAALGPGETFTVTARGSNGNCTGSSAIPANATGVQLNVTAIGATSPTFLTVWPADATQPTSSNLNPLPGQGPVPNAVTTGISTADGAFSIFNGAGNVNVFVDVVGYYTDHDHDDRYYTEAEVNALLPHAYAVGPVALTSFAAVASAPLDVATLNLPAGDFVVNANVVANNNGGGTVEVGCAIVLGTTTIASMFDSTGLALAPNLVVGDRESIALNGAGTLAAPATARLVCRVTGTLGNYLAASLVATSVPTLTKT